MLGNGKGTIPRYDSSNHGPHLSGVELIRSDQPSQQSVHGEPYVRVYLESTEYRCTCTNGSSKGQTPTVDAGITSVQAASSIQNELTNSANRTTLYTAITNNGSTCPEPTRILTSE